jgi:RNA polymerase sigma-70 factor (ECF subfamily)
LDLDSIAMEGGSFSAGLVAHQRRLLARIRRMMGPDAREGLESSDVLQSVYTEALQGLRAGSLGEEKLLPWMVEVARHKIIDEARRRRERPLGGTSIEPVDSPSSLCTRLSERETRRGLFEALSALEPERRRVIALRCEDGCSWPRIAVVLGRSEEAARKLYHRALLELGHELERRKLGAEPLSASG